MRVYIAKWDGLDAHGSGLHLSSLFHHSEKVARAHMLQLDHITKVDCSSHLQQGKQRDGFWGEGTRSVPLYRSQSRYFHVPLFLLCGAGAAPLAFRGASRFSRSQDSMFVMLACRTSRSQTFSLAPSMQTLGTPGESATSLHSMYAEF